MPPSDDLRAALSAAVDSTPPDTGAVSTVSAEPAAAPEPSAPASEPVAAPAAEAGATTLPDGEKAAGEPAKPSIEEVVAGEGDKTPAQKAETPAEREERIERQRVDRAPQSWKGESKKLWEQLPLQVRQEVVRRERDIQARLQESADARQKVSAMIEVMTPHRERIQASYGGNPVAAIDALLRTEQVLASGTPLQKANLVAQLIQNFGVDLRALDSVLSGSNIPEPVQQQDSIERLLEQKLAPIQQFLETQQQREARERASVQQSIDLTVAEMAQDTERFPYFEELRGEMADLVEMNARRGVALSLEDAYHKAVRMNDGAFKATAVREQHQSAQAAALEAHRAAQAAKGASVSVTGSPSGAGKQVSTGNASDLRGTIAAAFGGDRL